jgi:cytoskeleton protein RodZ
MQALAQPHGLDPTRVALGAGAMLRQAREAAGISREDLANRTRLELRIIQALEGEDYASLAAAAFTKGYIRSLSKELKIDPDPILSRYAHDTAIEDPALADFSTRSPAQITSSSHLIRGISIALGLGALVLIAMWWHRNYQADAEGSAPSTDPAAVASPDAGAPLPYTYTIIDHSTEPLGPTNSWRRQTDGSAPPVGLDTEQATPGDAADDSPAADETIAAPATASPSTSGELEFSGDGESWIEVSDFAGKRLYFGLIKPGQQIGLTGKPPYDLVIGNATAVKLSYRKQPVDVRARAVNGVARFSLGEPN